MERIVNEAKFLTKLNEYDLADIYDLLVISKLSEMEGSLCQKWMQALDLSDVKNMDYKRAKDIIATSFNLSSEARPAIQDAISLLVSQDLVKFNDIDLAM